MSAGLPGTGLYYSKTLPRPTKVTSAALNHKQELPAPARRRAPLSALQIFLVAVGALLAVLWVLSQSPAPRSSDQQAQQRPDTIDGAAENLTAPPATPSPPLGNASLVSEQSQTGTSKTAATPSVSMLTTAAVRLRSVPSAEGNAILTVPIGSTVKSFAAQGLWHNVIYGDQTGWIRGDYLTPSSLPGPAAAPTRPMSLLIPPVKPQTGTPAQRSSHDRYFTGPRGGCYYLNSAGNKTYVDRDFCR